jgi:hypothetical protein
VTCDVCDRDDCTAAKLVAVWKQTSGMGERALAAAKATAALEACHAKAIDWRKQALAARNVVIALYPHVYRDLAEHVRDEIQQMFPHEDARLHARIYSGESRCGIRPDPRVLPQLRFARQDREITCTACVEVFITQKEQETDELIQATNRAKEQLVNLKHGGAQR